MLGRPHGRRWLAGAAILVVAAGAAVLLSWRHGSPPQRTVRIAVYGARPGTAPQQPGIVYGGAGHMVPPTRQSPSAQQSPTDAYIEGALVGDSGQIVGIRMAPEVACQLTKAVLMTAPAAASC